MNRTAIKAAMVTDVTKNQLDILFTHGETFKPDTPGAYVYSGPPHQCFNNAAAFVGANPGWAFVEGVITIEGVTAHHAWVARGDGALEVTLDQTDTDKAKYFGVRLVYGAPRFHPDLDACYGDSLTPWLILSARLPARFPLRRPVEWDA